MISSSSSNVSSTHYGAPSSLRCDNGPELIAWALRDWCRMSRVGISYIEPGSPWENPYVESFNGRVRDELLNLEDFGSLLEAQVVVEAWRIEYNTYRPHGALGGLTPTEVTRRMDHRTPTSTLTGPPFGCRGLLGLRRIPGHRRAIAKYSSRSRRCSRWSGAARSRTRDARLAVTIKSKPATHSGHRDAADGVNLPAGK